MPPVENLTGGFCMSLFDCQRRVLWLLLIFSVCFVLLGGRLLCLQVFRGESLSRQAVRQRFQTCLLYTSRCV